MHLRLSWIWVYSKRYVGYLGLIFRKQNKVISLKLIVWFLHSEDLEGQEDHGHSAFLNLHTVLKGSIDGKQIFGVKAESIGEEVLPVNQDSVIDSEPKSYMKVHRLCEFKISGTIGSIDQNLSYTSLSFQMEKGKRQGTVLEIFKQLL